MMTEDGQSGLHPLHPLESLSCPEIEQWLERALRGRQPLGLVTPDEPPFLAIARHESGLDEIRRRDLRSSAAKLVQRYVVDGDTDDDYVASLLGLVDELDIRAVELPLFELGVSAQFDELPVRQQSLLLGTLIDMHVALEPKRWLEWARAGRHVALALTALLAKGVAGLDLLPELDVEEQTADAVQLVLSEHGRELEARDRERMLHRGREVVGRCSGHVRAAVQAWLDEQDTPVVEELVHEPKKHPHAGAGAFFDEYNSRHQLTHLHSDRSIARLASVPPHV